MNRNIEYPVLLSEKTKVANLILKQPILLSEYADNKNIQVFLEGTMRSLKNKKILIIYTGSTIGMIKGSCGYLPAPNMIRNTLEGLSIMHHPDMPAWELYEFDVLLDSSNIAVNEWNQIGRTI